MQASTARTWWRVLAGMPAALAICGCAYSAKTREETLHFESADGVPAAPAFALNPYPDAHFSLEFLCPASRPGVMFAPVGPLPPVLPADALTAKKGFDRAEMKIRVPAGADNWLSTLAIADIGGRPVPVPVDGANVTRTALLAPYGVQFIVKLAATCRELDGGVLRIGAQEIAGATLPAMVATLRLGAVEKVTTDCGVPFLSSAGHYNCPW